MPKKRTKTRVKTPRKKKRSTKTTGSIYRRVVAGGKTVKLKSPQGQRAKKLKKINYQKAAAKIRQFESLPFRNKINFTAEQKRIIARRWKRVVYYQSIKPGAKASPRLKKTNAIISRGRLVLYKQRGFKRTIGNWYVLDTLRARREYTIFLSQSEIYSIFAADSPLQQLRTVVLSRRPRGFLLQWAKGKIPEDEMYYSWVYGAYPAGKISEGSFDRYTVEHLKTKEQRQKITAIRLIYHVGGYDHDEDNA